MSSLNKYPNLTSTLNFGIFYTMDTKLFLYPMWRLISVLALSLILTSVSFADTPKTVNVTADVVNLDANVINLQSGSVHVFSPLSPNYTHLQYRHPWWINGGVGLTTQTTSNSPNNFGFDVGVNFQTARNQLLTIRSAGSDFIGGDYYDAALMYGLLSRNPNGYISAATGASAVFFNRSAVAEANIKHSSAFGVPLEVQAFWTPVPNFGLGVIAFGNVNEERSYCGLVLAIQLANLVPL